MRFDILSDLNVQLLPIVMFESGNLTNNDFPENRHPMPRLTFLKPVKIYLPSLLKIEIGMLFLTES